MILTKQNTKQSQTKIQIQFLILIQIQPNVHSYIFQNPLLFFSSNFHRMIRLKFWDKGSRFEPFSREMKLGLELGIRNQDQESGLIIGIGNKKYEMGLGIWIGNQDHSLWKLYTIAPNFQIRPDSSLTKNMKMEQSVQHSSWILK